MVYWALFRGPTFLETPILWSHIPRRASIGTICVRYDEHDVGNPLGLCITRSNRKVGFFFRESYGPCPSNIKHPGTPNKKCSIYESLYIGTMLNIRGLGMFNSREKG